MTTDTKPKPAPLPLNTRLDELQRYADMARLAGQGGRYADARQHLTDLRALCDLAVQASYVAETPEPDYDRILVDAVKAAVAYRNGGGARRRRVVYTSASYQDVYGAIYGRILPDGTRRIEGSRTPMYDERRRMAMERLPALIERGVLFQTPAGAYVGVRNGLPEKPGA